MGVWRGRSAAVAALVAMVPIAIWPVTSWRTVTSPGFLGLGVDGTRFLVVGATFVAGAFGLWGVASLRRSAGIAWALNIAVFSALAAASANAVAALAAVATVSLARWIGAGLLRRLWRGFPAAGVPVVDIGIGFAVLQSALFLVGVVGFLRVPVGYALIAAGLGVLPANVRDLRDSRPNPVSRQDRFGLIVAAAVTAPLWVWLAAPDVQYDSLYAKAWLPQQWALDGRIRILTDHPVLGTVGTNVTLAVPGHLLGAHATGRYLQALCGVAVIMSPWWLLSRGRQSMSRHAPRLGHTWSAGLAVVGLATVPHMAWQMTTAYDDLLVTVLLFAAVLIGRELVTKTGPSPVSGALLFGLLLGALLSSKLYLVPFATIAFVVFGTGLRLKSLVSAGGAATIVALPPLVLRLVATGNPVFPQFNAVFQSRFYAPVNESWTMPYYPDGSWTALLMLPIRAVSETGRFLEAAPSGSFGILVLGFGACVLGLVRGSGRAFAVLGLSLVVWWLELRYLRYALPLLVVATVLVLEPPSGRVVPVFRGRSDRARRAVTDNVTPALVGLLVAIMVGPALAVFWNVPDRPPFAVATGREARADYLRRALPQFRAVEFLNETAARGDGIVGVWARALLRGDLDSSPAWEAMARVALARPEGTESEQYKSVGFDWIVQSAYERENDNIVLPRSLLGTETLAWASSGIEVYRLRGASGPIPALYRCAGKRIDEIDCGGLADVADEGGVVTITSVCPGRLIEVVGQPSAGNVIDVIERVGGRETAFSRLTPQDGTVLAAQTVSSTSAVVTVSGLDGKGGIRVTLKGTCG